MTDFSYIKLIIWDLDDTLWHGTLSEGHIEPCDHIIQLIKHLTDCGIVNSICSKNDKIAVEKELSQLNILEYFVFNSIDWSPKGKRIQAMLSGMGLRAENVLFIDDNVSNLNEAIFFEPKIHIAEPIVISDLIKYFSKIPKSDEKHSRLNRYKILEQKRIDQLQYDNNEQFLYQSHICVEIKRDCVNQIDRITELVARTNQLNYTKCRSSKEELVNLISDGSIDSGYVTVKDRYGDYGIVGFFAVREHKCIHFLFSCRTIGQGVEQYVYSILKYPDIQVVGNVVATLKKETIPMWINQGTCEQPLNQLQSLSGKILFKGPCDLSSLAFNYETTSIVTEFTYIGEHGNSIEHHNHSINYLRFPFLTLIEKKELIDDCIFNDENMFNTDLYNPDVKLVFLSTLIESNLAIYKRKRDGYLLAFGEYCNDLTDVNRIDSFINGDLYCYSNKYTREWLLNFSKNWDYQGRISIEEYINNLNLLLEKLPKTTKICLLLGSEIPYLKNTKKAYEDRHLVHKEFNNALRIFAKNNSRILLLDFNDFIKSQHDFTDNINHFQRRVYYDICQKANEYIETILGEKVKNKSHLQKVKEQYTPIVRGWIFEHTPNCIKTIRTYLKNR